MAQGRIKIMRYEDIDWTQVEKRIDDALPLGKPTAEPKDWSNLDIDSYIQKALESTAVETPAEIPEEKPAEKPAVIPKEPRAKAWEGLDLDKYIGEALSSQQIPAEPQVPAVPESVEMYGRPVSVTPEELASPQKMFNKAFLEHPIVKGLKWYYQKREELETQGKILERQFMGKLPTIGEFGRLVEYIRTPIKGKDVIEIPEPSDWFSRIMGPAQLKYKSPSEARQLLQKMALEGKIPPPEIIKITLGDEMGGTLIRHILDASPRLFSKDAMRLWSKEREKIMPFYYAGKHPYIAAALSGWDDSVDQVKHYVGEVVWDELTDPLDWVLDFVVGKAIVVPATRLIKRSRLGQISLREILKSRIGDISRLKKIENPDILRQLLKQFFEKSKINPRAMNKLDNMPIGELDDLFTKVKSGQPVTVYLPIDDLPKVVGGAEKAFASMPPGWRPVTPEVDFETDQIAKKIISDSELASGVTPSPRTRQGLVPDRIINQRTTGGPQVGQEFVPTEAIGQEAISIKPGEVPAQVKRALTVPERKISTQTTRPIVSDIEREASIPITQIEPAASLDKSVKSMAKQLKSDDTIRLKEIREELKGIGKLKPNAGQDEEFVGYVPKYMRSKVGLTADERASEEGFDSAQELLEHIANLESERKAIAGKTAGQYYNEASDALQKLSGERFDADFLPAQVPKTGIMQFPVEAEEISTRPRAKIKPDEGLPLIQPEVGGQAIPGQPAEPIIPSGQRIIPGGETVGQIGAPPAIQPRPAGEMPITTEAILPKETIGMERGIVPEKIIAPIDIEKGLRPVAERKTTQQWLDALGYDKGMADDITTRFPTDAEWIVASKIPPQEIIRDLDGNIRPIGGATDLHPETGTTEQLTAKYAAEQWEKGKAASEAGFLRFGGKGYDPRGNLKNSVSPEMYKSMTAYREGHTFIATTWDEIKRIGRGIDELWHVKLNRQLQRAALNKNKYNEPIRHMMNSSGDYIRTDFVGIMRKAEEIAVGNAHSLWGDLNAKEQEGLAYAIYLRSLVERAGKGLDIPTGADASMVNNEFATYFGTLPDSVRDAFFKYHNFTKTFVMEHLIQRGKLDVDQIMDFYAPHYVLKYMFDEDKPSPWTLTKPLKPRFRGYTMKAKGSKSDIAVGLDIIEDNWTKVYADNMLDDNALMLLENADRVTRSELATMGIDTNLKVGRYKLGNDFYVAMQYEPGNRMFKGWSINEDLADDAIYDALLTNSGRRDEILNMPKDEQAKALWDYYFDVGPQGGDAVRQAIMLGKKKPIYLVPQELGYAVRNLKAENMYVPLMREIQRATSVWEGVVLKGIAIPYNVRNLLNYDLLNFAGFLGSHEHIPSVSNSIGRSFKVLHNLHKVLADHNALGPGYKDLVDMITSKDIIGSSYLSEYVYRNPTLYKRAWQTPERWMIKRELLLRVAMADFQLNRVKKNLPLIEGPLAKKLQGFTVDQKIGAISRQFTGDYGDTPPWFDSFFRRLGIPFGLGAIRGRQAIGGLVKEGTIGGRPDKFLLPFAAAVGGVYAWNHRNAEVAEIYNKLGNWNDKFLTVIGPSYDDNGDGKLDRVTIMSPRTGLDEAGEWFGIDHIIQAAHKIAWLKEEKGIVTKKDYERIGKQLLRDVLLATPEEVRDLLTPIVQIIMGVYANKDPFDNQRVFPDDLTWRDHEAVKYIVPYVFGKLFTPMERYMTPRNADKPWLGVKDGFKDPATGFRTLYEALSKGPANVAGAFGIHEIDLNDVATAEAQIAKKRVEARKKLYKSKIVDEFIYNTPPEFSEAYTQFWQQLGDDLQNLDTDKNLSPIGEVLRDARSENIDLTDFIFGGYKESGTLMNRLYNPSVLSYKINNHLRTKIGGWAYRGIMGEGGLLDTQLNHYDRGILTDEQIRVLRQYDNILLPVIREMKLKPDKGVEIETMRQILPILGINAQDYFQQLGISPEQLSR